VLGGGEVDNQSWKELWDGRAAFNDTGEPIIEVIKGKAQTDSQIDGLSGATLTGRGVANLIRYWTGPHGFGPYLAKLREEANDDD